MRTALGLIAERDIGGTAQTVGSVVNELSRATPKRWHPRRSLAPEPLLNIALETAPDGAADRYAHALARLAEQPGESVSLAINLPFCAAQCLCCTRDIASASPASFKDDYVDALIAEMEQVAWRIGHRRDVLQLHLGGGTANELSPTQLLRLLETVRRLWRLPADAEMSVECDPRRIGQAHLELLRGLGFRHLVLTVFDLCPDVQQAIGRCQSVALVNDVCEVARRVGIEYIDFEVMIGLPHQTPERWARSLAQIVRLAPDRVTLARYRHIPWQARPQQGIDATALPDAQACTELAALTASTLCDAGYEWIGDDHFVLDTDELIAAREQGLLRRSLISYTATPPTPLLGFGVGAIGEVQGSMFWNESAIPAWHSAVQARRLPVAHAQLGSPRESQRRLAVQQLWCQLELSAAAARGGLEAAYRRLAGHAEAGLVEVHEDRIVVTEAGRHALPMLCQELAEGGCANDEALEPHVASRA